ncbi:MAG: zf-HC2 domain-containing protein [Actinomycetota bacterium]|nr:zf-HC2 domain-containing protein [Actinomycetota bacterium]
MTCTHTPALGAYLLGALDPGERAHLETHLADCAVCQAEMLRLAPLPGLLHRITPADFEEPAREPVDFGLPADLSEPTETAGRRRPAVALVAAAVVVALCVGGVVGYFSRQPTAEQNTQAVTWSATNPDGVKADVDLTDHPWGTELQIRLRDVPSGRPCKLIVRGRDGYRETAGWWATTAVNGEWIPGSTSIDLASIDQVEVVAGDAVLVNIPAPS